MKSIVFVLSGIADEPLEELNHNTPLAISKTPHMDALAAVGRIGQAQFMPKDIRPSVENSALSLLGYAEDELPGRGLLDALGIGVPLQQGDIAWSCQLVTEEEGVLKDCTAGHIAPQEASVLVEELNKHFKTQELQFYSSDRGSFVMVAHKGKVVDEAWRHNFHAPHEMVGFPMKHDLPKGEAGVFLSEVLKQAKTILVHHEINKVRLDLGENPANALWVWGGSQKETLPSFESRFNRSAGIVSTSDMMQGIAEIAGLDHCMVLQGGCKESSDLTVFSAEAKKMAANHDLVILYLNDADRASYEGDYKKKVRWIEAFDQYVLADVMGWCSEDTQYLISSNHVTPVNMKAQIAAPAPILMAKSNEAQPGSRTFTEEKAAKSGWLVNPGNTLMKLFLE